MAKLTFTPYDERRLDKASRVIDLPKEWIAKMAADAVAKMIVRDGKIAVPLDLQLRFEHGGN